MYICAYVERKREFVRLTVRNCTKKSKHIWSGNKAFHGNNPEVLEGLRINETTLVCYLHNNNIWKSKWNKPEQNSYEEILQHTRHGKALWIKELHFLKKYCQFLFYLTVNYKYLNLDLQ